MATRITLHMGAPPHDTVLTWMLGYCSTRTSRCGRHGRIPTGARHIGVKSLLSARPLRLTCVDAAWRSLTALRFEHKRDAPRVSADHPVMVCGA